MDQNFSLMAQSRANYYTAGSPVQFVRVELLKGDVTGEVAVCLTFKNVGTEPLTGFIIHFKCKDASGQILCEDDFYYEQLNVQPGELFGADDAVFVSDTPVSSVEIEQDRAFLNGRGVDLRNYKRVRLQAPRVLPGSIARTLQTRTNNKMLTCVPQDTENGWFCACGAFHPNEEAVSVCSECGGDRAYIKATLTRILEEARQAAEQQQREINAVANGVDPAAAQAAQAAATAAAAQAAISQDLALSIGQGTKLYGELLHTAIGLNSHGGYGIGSFQQSLAHAGQVDAVAQFKHAGVLHQEGQHAPVDAVGAVALGCILLGKVGRAAQHALAGSRLLTCGAIAGLIGKDGGANVGGCGVRLVTGLFQRGIHSLYFFRQSACRRAW